MRSALALLLAAAAAPSLALAGGDADRGAKLHESCYVCHGPELYLPPKAKVRRLKDLRHATERWAEYYNPAFSKQELEDLFAYLNRDYYRLKK